MLSSYHTAPKKPEKSTKVDHGQDRTEHKEIANVEKKDRSAPNKNEHRKKPN
jgi:hypothetical protein